MSTARDLKRETEEIKALLIAKIDTLCRDLAPEGKRKGGYWIARNPTRADQKAGSFWVHLTGKPGAWLDAATGDKGDVFGLVAYCKGFAEFKQTIAWCRDWLRLPEMASEERDRLVNRARRVQAEDNDAKEDWKRRKAHAIYINAKDKARPFLGSPADLYLQGRGIDVRALGRMPGCLGWLPSDKHYETGTSWPVMVAAFTAPDGVFKAIHRTFLSQQGGQWTKAPVDPARKAFPSCGGAAIRLWRGASNLSIDDANKQAVEHGVRETLVLTEGVEDALSVALARPDLRVWAAYSLGNLALLKMPPAIDQVIVCADNDWGKIEAQRQLDRAVDGLIAQGVEVSIARSHIGKDVNDALRGAA